MKQGAFAGALALFLGGVSVARSDDVVAQSMFSVASQPPPGFADAAELGLTLTTGNTTSSTLSGKERASYRWPEETIAMNFRYLESSAGGVDNAKNWGAGARYERRLVPHLGFFAGELEEADPFSGYLQRYSSDLGLRRTIWANETSRGALEAGYRYQIENRGDENRDFRQLARLFGEMLYRWNPHVSSVVSVEGLPNLANSSDWLLNGEVAIQAAVTNHLSLKTSYVVRYSHEPAAVGLKTTDTTLTTAFVASF